MTAHTATKATDTNAELYREFNDLVNMAPAELDKWLQSEQSKAVGQKPEDRDESLGHESGRLIITIKRKRRAELTEADYHQMQRVVSYIKRHTAQRPDGDVSDTRWRYSLMNWGYDPLKAKA